jgi:hypothetical protein
VGCQQKRSLLTFSPSTHDHVPHIVYEGRRTALPKEFADQLGSFSFLEGRCRD